MHRYFGKEAGSINKLEGIYSVSCVITKSSKAFLSGRKKMKIVERKDNYARVAILKDWPGTKRDFIEVSLSYHVTNKYPIVPPRTSPGERRSARGCGGCWPGRDDRGRGRSP